MDIGGMVNNFASANPVTEYEARETSIVQANGMNYDDVSQPNIPDVSECAPTNTTYNVIDENVKEVNSS